MIPIIHPPLEECLFSHPDYSLRQLKLAFVDHISTYNQEAPHDTEITLGKANAYFKYFSTYF